MSERHPIISITGSSGAGTTSVTRTFENIFRRDGVAAAIVEGDSFHRYNRAEMKRKLAEADASGNKHFSHFGPRTTCSPSSRGCSRATAKRVRVNAASTCTMSAKQRRTNKNRAPSPTGKPCLPRPTCCSTKACTARW